MNRLLTEVEARVLGCLVEEDPDNHRRSPKDGIEGTDANR